MQLSHFHKRLMMERVFISASGISCIDRKLIISVKSHTNNEICIFFSQSVHRQSKIYNLVRLICYRLAAPSSHLYWCWSSFTRTSKRCDHKGLDRNRKVEQQVCRAQWKGSGSGRLQFMVDWTRLAGAIRWHVLLRTGDTSCTWLTIEIIVLWCQTSSKWN